MNRLRTELQRLYAHPAAAPVAETAGPADAPAAMPPLAGVAADGTVRTLLVDFRQSADWPQLATLYEALQAELDLPAPGVSVDARHGYRLWLSLAEPVPLAEARRFLESLRSRYLADLAPARLALRPQDAPGAITPVPAPDAASGKWSAFIDPSLGEMFSAEAGLDMAPNMARQAEMLAGLASIPLADFRRAAARLATPLPDSAAPGADDAPSAENPAALAGGHLDPKRFLLAVINNPAVDLRDRIEAAKALLPYWPDGA